MERVNDLLALKHKVKVELMSKHKHSNEICKFRKKLLKKLPPIIARKDVVIFLGGAVSAKTLANADSLNEGPSRAFLIGRNVVYPTKNLIDWIIKRLGISSMKY